MTLSLPVRIGLVVFGAALVIAGVALRESNRDSSAFSGYIESRPDGTAAVLEVDQMTASVDVVFEGSVVDAEAFLVTRQPPSGAPSWPVALIVLGVIGMVGGIVGRLPSRRGPDIREGFGSGHLRDELAAYYDR
jgi:hypothetical protein